MIILLNVFLLFVSVLRYVVLKHCYLFFSQYTKRMYRNKSIKQLKL